MGNALVPVIHFLIQCNRQETIQPNVLGLRPVIKYSQLKEMYNDKI